MTVITARNREHEVSEVEPDSNSLAMLGSDKMRFFECSLELQELCSNNGITSSEFVKNCHVVTELDMFLGVWRCMKPVEHFAALKKLSIIACPSINCVEGVEHCQQLEALCITECSLNEMPLTLAKCRNLRYLNLSANKISVMGECLLSLSNLEKLWLNDNQLSAIANMSELKNLKELWLCRNQLQRIDDSLEFNQDLIELNVADNRIYTFKTLSGLACLPKLTSFALQDAHFGSNYVCKYSNYQTYALYHLGESLQYLDTMQISPRQKEFAERTMVKKKLFYNVEIKKARHQLQQRIAMLNKARSKDLRAIESILVDLQRHRYDLWNCVDNEEAADDNAQINEKIRNIEAHEKVVRRAHDDNQSRSKHTESQLERASKQQIGRFMLEFDTGGNIKLEDGKGDEEWYQNVLNMIGPSANSTLSDQKSDHVHVTRATRISNRYLKSRFYETKNSIERVHDVIIKPNISKRGITTISPGSRTAVSGLISEDLPDDDSDLSDVECEELYEVDVKANRHPAAILNQSVDYVACTNVGTDCPGRPDHVSYLTSIAENGFTETQLKEILFSTCPAGVIDSYIKGMELSNQATTQESEKLTNSNQILNEQAFIAPTEYLLISKLFPGYTVQCGLNDINEGVDLCEYPGVNTIQSTFSDAKQGVEGSLFRVLDPAIIFPEYIVSFQYFSISTIASDGNRVEESSGFDAIMESFRCPKSRQDTALDLSALLFSAKELKTMDPFPLSQARAFAQSYSLNRLQIPASLSSIKHLSLLGCNLTSLPACLSPTNMCSLESLILSENILTGDAFTEVSGSFERLNLLNLAYNQIEKVSIEELFPAVRELDLSHNKIASFEGLEIANLNQLTHFCLQSNPLCKKKHFRVRICSINPYMRTLNFDMVTSEELLIAAQLTTGLEHDVMETKPIREVQLCLDHQLIHSQCFHSNIRILSVNDTDLESLSGLRQCLSLEELHAENNFIFSVDEDLPYLVNLRILHLGRNQLTNFPNVQNLKKLLTLSLEENLITTLDNLILLQNERTSPEIEHSSELLELYLGRNKISNLGDIAALKVFSKLVVVELLGNPWINFETQYSTTSELEVEYRLYTIFHLRRVQVLDFQVITTEEFHEAKQRYNGKLRLEMLIVNSPPSTEDKKNEGIKPSTPSRKNIMQQCAGLQHINLSSSRLRDLQHVLTGTNLPSLTSLDLENNCLTNIDGLECLSRLRILNLRRNRIETLLSPTQTLNSSIDQAYIQQLREECKGIFALPSLQILQLSYNKIHDMRNLGLCYLTSLEQLQLDHNSVQILTALECNKTLKELQLEGNSIHQIDPNSLAALGPQLENLNLECNSLRTVHCLYQLSRLAVLDLSCNRINDLDDLEVAGPTDESESSKKSSSLPPNLRRLRLAGNGVIKRQLYRPSLIAKLHMLVFLDGKEITREERLRAQKIISLQEGSQSATTPTFGTQAIRFRRPAVPIAELQTVALEGVPLYSPVKGFDMNLIKGSCVLDTRQIRRVTGSIATSSESITNSLSSSPSNEVPKAHISTIKLQAPLADGNFSLRSPILSALVHNNSGSAPFLKGRK
uniref:Uncharacterized protein AlNc14C4G557 n=1 Tax=Albugo laibachii Nc14 TaxID=890382 RepID=F0W0B4_9STRA|nr:conserved hypothetical protein [Albugo laibachii Nc14]|eukprot:CCA14486.1 conserved hypothetical protein [Albugo laibachii Nc14]